MKDRAPTITAPDHPALDELCQRLQAEAAEIERSGAWPTASLRLCADYGVFTWFVPRHGGGLEWSDVDLVRGYLRLSAACLTTTFILTQRTSACRWIVDSEHAGPRERWLPGLVSGECFATVGISQLTTSRRHVGRPVLAVRETSEGFTLDGYTPWVTGADHANLIVTGGTLDDGRQVLLAVPTDRPGLRVDPPASLVGLSASHTGEVHYDSVPVDRSCLLAGPIENVLSRRSGAGAGGLQTSALAIGLAAAAIEFLEQESQQRPELKTPAESLRREQQQAVADVLRLAGGEQVCSTEDLRSRANSLTLRASQAALTVAKGTGYVTGHPAGRWCREALFFLVWSCPQPVANAALCELAGLG